MRRALLLPLLLVTPLLVALLLVALLVTCKGGTDLTDREISDAELVAMVLPQEELGSAYADFDFNEDASGFRSNQDIIDDAFDEEDETEDIEKFGRVNGYGEVYGSEEALIESQGAFSIRTILSLYEDADGASGDLEDVLEDAKDTEGMTDEGLTVEDVEEFHPTRVGDESLGLSVTFNISDGQKLTFYQTSVGFRRGRLIGAVTIIQLDEADVRDEAEDLARKLDERIVAVLRGDIEPRGTPTPRPTPTPEALTREDALDILPQMMLQPEDLPEGFRVVGSAFDSLAEEAIRGEDPDRFRRALESWGFVLGHDKFYLRDAEEGLLLVNLELWLLQDEQGAEEAFILGALVPSFDETVTVEPAAFPTFGDESDAFRIAGPYLTPEGGEIPAEGYVVVIRVGQFLGMVQTARPAGEAGQAESEELAGTLESRMRQHARQ